MSLEVKTSANVTTMYRNMLLSADSAHTPIVAGSADTFIKVDPGDNATVYAYRASSGTYLVMRISVEGYYVSMP
jgi:hypothetical protein